MRGTLCRGPNNKDYSILGSILGSPYLGKLPYGGVRRVAPEGLWRILSSLGFGVQDLGFRVLAQIKPIP